MTANQQLADELSAMLDQFEAKVPDFEQQHPLTLPFVRAHRFVPTSFLGSAIAAVDASPELQGVKKLDVDEGREVLQFMDAFRPIEVKLLSLAKGLHYTIEARRAGLAANSLQIYAISKGVVRDPASAPLIGRVQAMKQDLGRSNRKKKGGQQTPGTTTAGTTSPAGPTPVVPVPAPIPAAPASTTTQH
jgi:hypothetical protein